MPWKIRDLTAATSVARDDLVEITVDPAGAPASRKATIQALATAITPSFDSTAALRSDNNYFNRRVVILLGAASAGDGNGGVYYYDSLSAAVDNSLSVIKPDSVSGAGRYLKLI